MPSGRVNRLNLAREGFDLGNDVERLLCKGCEKGLRLEVLQGRCGFSAVHAMVLKVGHGDYQGISGRFKWNCNISTLSIMFSSIFGGPTEYSNERIHGLGCFSERESRSREPDNLHGVGC
jgi:hypothetical protein